MFLNFFNELRAAKVPVTLKEYLALMEAMDKGVIDRDVEDFYYLARAALVKDERNIDKFDKVFGHVFKGLDSLGDAVEAQDLPEEWLRKMTEKFLSPEEMAEIEAMGGFEKLMETLKKRLEEQKKRHEGGNKWIGTGGTSPFGANGYNPEGIRIGQDKSPRRAQRSRILNITTSTIALMKGCGKTIGGAARMSFRPGMSCINIRATTKSSLSATPR